jgi:hypothetical protein
MVAIDELTAAINMALEGLTVEPFCPAALCACQTGSPCAAGVGIDCLVRAVGRALGGCPAP